MAELSPAQQAERDFPWNFSVNTLDIVLITFGLSLISRETVLPVLVSHLTDSRLAIGLIPAFHALGYYLPQLFSANFSERLRYKKPFVLLLGGVAERLPYLLLALIVWQWAVPHPTRTLTLLLLLLAVTALGAGVATPAWFDMIAKVIPVQRRGLWAGLSHSLGALLGVVGAYYLVGRILVTYPYPQNFALLFGLATVGVFLSYIGLSLNREPPTETVKAQIPLLRYLGQLPEVLRRDRNYRRFLIGRTVTQLGAMASGFFMVYGTERLGVDGAGVGLLTGVLIASQALMNLVWGFVGDRVGHKTVLTGAAFAVALSAAVAWFAVSQGWLVVTFVFLGAYLAADATSGLNIILEFCDPQDRPTYIGLTNTLLAPVLIFAPILGGGLAQGVGFQGLFAVAAVAATGGALLLAFWVREPRLAGRGQ